MHGREPKPVRRDKRHASRVFNDLANKIRSDRPVNSPIHASRFDSAQFSRITPEKRLVSILTAEWQRFSRLPLRAVKIEPFEGSRPTL
jgi:hypothetical protein